MCYSTSNLTYRLYWKRHPCIFFNKCFLATNYFVLNLFLPYIIFWSHPKNLSKSLAFWCFQGESLKETLDRKQSINPGKVSWTCRFSFFSSSTILNWTRVNITKCKTWLRYAILMCFQRNGKDLSFSKFWQENEKKLNLNSKSQIYY